MRLGARSLVWILLAAGPVAAQPSAADPKPPPNPADKYKLDAAADRFVGIRDNTPFPWLVKTRELGEAVDLDMETYAFEDVLIHAAQFTPEELEQQARRDVAFGTLLGPHRREYRCELLRFEGRLLRLQKAPVRPHLKLQGVEEIFEGWVFPFGEGDPLCVFVTQLPPGLSPQKDIRQPMNVPVAVTGYFFKLVRYEQMAFDRNNPGKHRVWAAPVLIGRSLTLLPHDPDAGGLAWPWLMPLMAVGFSLVGVVIALLAWRYRREDRAWREQLQEKRNQNPFESV